MDEKELTLEEHTEDMVDIPLMQEEIDRKPVSAVQFYENTQNIREDVELFTKQSYSELAQSEHKAANCLMSKPNADEIKAFFQKEDFKGRMEALDKACQQEIDSLANMEYQVKNIQGLSPEEQENLQNAVTSTKEAVIALRNEMVRDMEACYQKITDAFDACEKAKMETDVITAQMEELHQTVGGAKGTFVSTADSTVKTVTAETKGTIMPTLQKAMSEEKETANVREKETEERDME